MDGVASGKLIRDALAAVAGVPSRGRPSRVRGIAAARRSADESAMIWPVAALAVLLVGFVVFYGSVLQARLGVGDAEAPRDETLTEA